MPVLEVQLALAALVLHFFEHVIKLLFISLIAALSIRAHAKGELEPTFGSECTATNEEIVRSDLAPWGDRETMHEALKTKHYFLHLVKAAAKSRAARFVAALVTADDVLWKPDVAVMECNTRPHPYSFLAQNELEFQSLIFEAATDANLEPHEYLGGGHMHIGGVFKNNPQLLRDFTVDFFNNPALAMGTFHYNPAFALHIADADPAYQLAFLKMVQRFDQDMLDGEAWTAEKFAKELHDGVFEDFVNPFLKLKDYEAPDMRSFALNLRNFMFMNEPPLNTVEIRSILPQKHFHQFVLQAKLFRARINWLAEHPHQQPRLVFGPRTLDEAQREFRRYVEECGLDWNEYKYFTHPDWVRNPFAIMRKDPFEYYKYSETKKAKLLREYDLLSLKKCEASILN